MMHFLGPCRKLLLGTPVNDCDLGAEPQCRPRGIHGHVSSAHYGYPVTRIDWCHVVVAVSFHQIVPRQELIRRKYPVEILAGNVHESRKPCSGTYENSLVSFIVEQFVYAYGLPNHGIGLYADPHGFDIGYFAGHHGIFRKPELGNAVFKHAAGLVQGFEHSHLITEFCKVASTGQRSRAAAHYGDAMPVGRGALGKTDSVFTAPVPYETLQLAYRYRLPFHTEDATAFALQLLRADPAAYRRQ